MVIKAEKNVRICRKKFTMIVVSLIQKFLRWLPLLLLIFLFIIDRDNLVHVVVYIFILLSYTGILVLKILYAKKNWHKEFGK